MSHYETKLPCGTVGAIGEMIVCADLMRRGWHVYRQVSSHTPLDLLARRGRLTIGVEVRSGRLNKSGRLCYSTPADRVHTWDVMAVVLPDRSIRYLPELDAVPGIHQASLPPLRRTTGQQDGRAGARL